MAESLANAQVTNYQIHRARNFSSGLIAMPQAGLPGTPMAFVRVAAPTEYEQISWLAVCEAALPVVPRPNDPNNPLMLNANMVLLEATRGVPVPMQTQSGAKAWAIAGIYKYALLVPEGPVNDIKTGRMPWEPSSDTVFNQSMYSATVLDTSVPTTQYPIPPFPPTQRQGP